MSIIRFGCPSCGKAFTANVELSGKLAQCRTCGTTLRIPVAFPDQQARTETGLCGIDGWLQLPGLMVILSPIGCCLSFGTISRLSYQYAATGLAGFFGLIQVMNACLLIASIWIGLVFFGRSSSAPKLLMLFYGSVLARNIILSVVLSMKSIPTNPIDIVAPLAWCAICVPYLLFSRRVRNTFTE